MTEVRLALFFAAGATIAAASATRCEGLLLLIPLVVWSVARWRALDQGRTRLAVGAIACLAVLPAVAMLALLLAGGRGQAGELFHLRLLILAQRWLQALPAALLGHSSARRRALAGLVGTDSLWGRMLEIYVPHGCQGPTLPWLAPLAAVASDSGAAAMGVAAGRPLRAGVGPGRVAAVDFVGPFLLTHSSRKRYVFAAVLLGSGLAALGLLRVSDWMGRVAVRWRPLWGPPFRAVPVPGRGGAAWATAFSFDGRPIARPPRVELGRWLRDRAGPSPVLFGPDGFTQVVSYYARGKCAFCSSAPRPTRKPSGCCLPSAGPTWPLLPRDEAAGECGRRLFWLAAVGCGPAANGPRERLPQAAPGWWPCGCGDARPTALAWWAPGTGEKPKECWPSGACHGCFSLCNPAVGYDGCTKPWHAVTDHAGKDALGMDSRNFLGC